MDAISGIGSRIAASGLGGAGGLQGPRPVDSGAIQVPAIGPSSGAKGATFEDTLKRFVSDVSGQQDAATDLQGRFMRGENVELHQVMAATEEASLSMDLMVELRNKVMDAYKTLVAMQ